jgi:aspartyl-tRNA(Asn)/glutamyl-tRNA(Gln) amidotransferase subunit A
LLQRNSLPHTARSGRYLAHNVRMHPASHAPSDLHAMRDALRRGTDTATDRLNTSLAVAHSAACQNAWVLPPDAAEAHLQLQALERRHGQHLTNTPLAGLAVSVKDLFDVAGQVTTSGSRVLGPDGVNRPAAAANAPAVARLRAAGAVIFGRTQMSEFAFSGVGVNPHHGTPYNPCDTTTPRIPGGSSSGGAVTVAAGATWAALGSDTGGSIRIPAALCGIVGFKSSAQLVPTEGAFPLSTTLDTVAAMTLSVRDAMLLHEVLAARQVVRSPASLRECRIAVPRHTVLDGLDATVARAFERSLSRLSAAGAQIVDIPLPELGEAADMQARCTFPAAEAFSQQRAWVQDHAALYDPRVLARIQRGGTMLAGDYIDLQRARADWMRRVNRATAPFDALLSPTVPMVAPPLAEVAPGTERDEAFFAVNARLLRNTALGNLLDGCGLSLPCHRGDELPVGLMLWHGNGRDDGVLHVAQLAERALEAA